MPSSDLLLIFRKARTHHVFPYPPIPIFCRQQKGEKQRKKRSKTVLSPVSSDIAATDLFFFSPSSSFFLLWVSGKEGGRGCDGSNNFCFASRKGEETGRRRRRRRRTYFSPSSSPSSFSFSVACKKEKKEEERRGEGRLRRGLLHSPLPVNGRRRGVELGGGTPYTGRLKNVQ